MGVVLALTAACLDTTDPLTTAGSVTMPDPGTMISGSAAMVVATVRNIRGGVIGNLSIGAYRSSDTAVATIDAAGIVHALKVGTTQLTATYSGITSPPVVLTVVPGPLYAFTKLADLPAQPIAGATYSVSVVASDFHGNRIPGLNIDFVVTKGGGSVDAATATTNQAGIAAVGFTMGTAPGFNTLDVSPHGYAAFVVFSATSASPPE
jgi:hypothetical protein